MQVPACSYYEVQSKLLISEVTASNGILHGKSLDDSFIHSFIQDQTPLSLHTVLRVKYSIKTQNQNQSVQTKFKISSNCSLIKNLLSFSASCNVTNSSDDYKKLKLEIGCC